MNEQSLLDLSTLAWVARGVIALVASQTLLCAQQIMPEPTHVLAIKSKCSLIHLGSLDSFDITTGGVSAAKLLYESLSTGKTEPVQKAIYIYDRITPVENFGGEYTALDWICHYQLAGEAERQKMTADRVSAEFYKYFAANDFKTLKDYLKMKYHFEEWAHKKTPKKEPYFRFLEDFILFNNPWREHWERTGKIMDVLDLKPGNVVADVGCGPGYFTFKFSEAVGDGGAVYAIETNPSHINYVTGLIQKFKVKNIQCVRGTEAGYQIDRKADLTYLCSMYHNVYALSTDTELASFLGAIRKNMKSDGSLVVVDNALIEDSNLPYHGPYISKDLIVEQLWYHGFRLVKSYQFIPQRYVLVFKQMPIPQGGAPVSSSSNPLEVPVTSGRALVHCVFDPGFTLPGRKAARLFLKALESGEQQDYRAASDAFGSIVPKERFGDEYSAFQWLCSYAVATGKQKRAMSAWWPDKEYCKVVSADNFKKLKLYLKTKYFLDRVLDDEDAARSGKPKEGVEQNDLSITDNSPMAKSEVIAFGEYLGFSSPARSQWEKTQSMLDFLKIRKGERIADLGSGAGYFTFRFSDAVGSTGSVFAVDTENAQLDSVVAEAKEHAQQNVCPILARDNDPKLPPDSVDLVYICSMYHAAYFISMEYVRDGFVDGIKKALCKNGRLVIADNAILSDNQNRYYGPGIAPELIIAQLKHYGFRLVDRAQFIPQRYMLVFERE